MSLEQNKAVVCRAYEAVFSGRHPAILDELFTPDCIVHQCGVLEPLGLDALKERMGPEGAFSDHQRTLDTIVAEGDMVALRSTLSGRHTRDFFRAATGKQVSFTIMTFARLEDGKIAEVWNNWDTATLLSQLDAWPEPPGRS